MAACTGKFHLRRRRRPAAAPTRFRLVAIDLDGTLLSSRKTHHTQNAHGHPGSPGGGREGRTGDGTAAALRTRLLRRAEARYADDQLQRGIDLGRVARRKAEHVPLEAAVAWKIIKWGRKLYPKLMVSVEILDKWYTDHYEEMPEYMTETAKQFAPDFIGPLEAFLKVPITKLMLLWRRRSGSWSWSGAGGENSRVSFRTRVRNAHAELMSPKTSKARALAKIAHLLEVRQEEVLAIGDAPNDVRMLEWAGTAAVPANGWEAATGGRHHCGVQR